MLEVILKRFENPDEDRVFEKGKLEIVRIGGMTIGRATYQPGWKWSEHVESSLRHPALRGRARRDGFVGARDGRDERWRASGTHRGKPLLCAACPT